MWASHSSFSFGAGDDAAVRCLTFADSRPQLHIDGKGFGIVLFPSLDVADLLTEHTVRFARELAEQAGVYLAEIERLYAAQSSESAKNTTKPGAAEAA